ncbi:insulinase family protein [Niveibacterium sp. 24ML]|uniref:M16 family metallopeptidase n=1 Tax=Niveibacterium sp. 24ML TaxID=2985512 RepID=UPI0022704C5A|nr:pitrilysin family protein [Niveibacterium sp. 24ML]MCX9157885.1 insulinase family protein [Niveibacterium sp. 24ML]
MRRPLFSALLLATALVSAPLAAKPAKPAKPAVAVASVAAPQRIQSIEGITEYRLGNGLRVLLAPDASKPTATLNLTYLVGSRHENYGETGMAHLLEHLVFKGTPSLKDGALVAGLKARGMQYNGTTSDDRTNYFETFSASDDNLDWALKMEADRMVNSFIARKDLDTEMTVVRNEMEAGENNPAGVLFQKMLASAYQWHNYGKTTIGARSDVEQVNIERLQAFYRKYYQPDNAVLVLTGKFDEASALAKIQRYFGVIPKPTRVLERTWTRDPVQDGERQVSLSRVGDYQMVAAIYHIPNGPHPDVAALTVFASVLDDVPSGRLHKALVETRKAAQVGAGPSVQAEPGNFSLYAVVDKAGDLEAVRRILLAAPEEVLAKPVTEEELKRAKLGMANSYEKLMNNPERLGVALSSAIAQGDWRLLFLQRDQIEAVTLADVQRVAANYFKASNRTVGIFVPTDKPERVAMPEEAQPAVLLKDYVGRKAVEAGEAFDPSYANVAARTQHSALPNGAKLALLSKTTRGNTVTGRMVLRFGDPESLKGLSTVAEASSAMLLRGAGGMSREQISDRLEALKATLSIGRSGNAISVSFEARRDTLADFLPLLAQILRRPDFPASEFEQLRAQWLTGIEAGRREPQSIVSRALGRHDNPYPKGDWRYAATVEEDLEAIRSVALDALPRFHAEFIGAQNAQIALVGDFDAAAASAQIGQLFGDWVAKRPFARIPQPYRKTLAAELSFETPEKANAVFVASLRLPVSEGDPQAAPLMLANRILGGGAMRSRLGDRLRQKEGISYGAGSALGLSAEDRNSGLTLHAIYAPQNRARVQAAVREELERLLKDGVTAEELADARSGVLQEISIARTRDSVLASEFVGHLYLGRNQQWEADFVARIQAASVADVNAALREFVQADAFAAAYAGDFAKAAATR